MEQNMGPVLLHPKLPPNPRVLGSDPFEPACLGKPVAQADCQDSYVPLEENPNHMEKAKSTWL